jgi:hypothetical protein
VFRYLFAKRRAKSIQDSLWLPFDFDSREAFLQGYCSKCSAHIPESSLFGNSLVATEDGIAVICANCRLGKQFIMPFELEKFSHVVRIDRPALLIEIYHNSKKGMPWVTIALILRCNYYGMSGRNFRKAFSPKLFETWNDIRHSDDPLYRLLDRESTLLERYGNEDEEAICGECGESSPDQACRTCGFPTNMQWWDRMTFDEEFELLSLAEGKSRLALTAR